MLQVHVVLSFAGIVFGFLVLAGFFAGKLMRGSTVIFLATMIATCITGFFLPFQQITPAVILGIITLVTLAIAIVARYRGWRKTYVIAMTASLYFDCFVLVVQSFEKVPALHALAPTQKEPPFAIAQLLLLVLFITLGIFAISVSASLLAIKSPRDDG